LGSELKIEDKNKICPEVLRKHRKKRRESQFRFWARFGVTQSSGSRFEMGADIPPPVAILLKLYMEGVVTDGDLWRIRRQSRLALIRKSGADVVMSG
jgi:RsaL-like HTH domain